MNKIFILCINEKKITLKELNSKKEELKEKGIFVFDDFHRNFADYDDDENKNRQEAYTEELQGGGETLISIDCEKYHNGREVMNTIRKIFPKGVIDLYDAVNKEKKFIGSERSYEITMNIGECVSIYQDDRGYLHTDYLIDDNDYEDILDPTKNIDEILSDLYYGVTMNINGKAENIYMKYLNIYETTKNRLSLKNVSAMYNGLLEGIKEFFFEW